MPPTQGYKYGASQPGPSGNGSVKKAPVVPAPVIRAPVLTAAEKRVKEEQDFNASLMGGQYGAPAPVRAAPAARFLNPFGPGRAVAQAQADAVLDRARILGEAKPFVRRPATEEELKKMENERQVVGKAMASVYTYVHSLPTTLFLIIH